MKLTFKRLLGYVRAHWRLICLYVFGVAVVSCLMLFKLGSLTHGLSAAEIQQAEFSSSWRHIADSPLHLPLTFIQWIILTVVPHHGNTVTRAASPVFALGALLAFAYVLRRWYGIRTAIFGSVIFGLSAWFLHVSRYASTDVLYLWAIPTLLAILIAWDKHHSRRRATYCAIAALSLLLYIPGLVWLILASLLLQPHLLTHSWQITKSLYGRIIVVLLPLLLVTPLIVAFVNTPSLAQTWLGLPQNFGTPESVVRNLVHSISFFVYKGPDTPTLWLARTPILSFFGTVMALLGVLFYATHFRAPRTRWLLALFIISALLFAMGGPVTISILVPLMYLLVSAGIGYLLHEWLQVFPRNPLARSAGFVLLGIAVALSCAYNLKSYYVAWPHNTAAQAAFRKHD